MKVFKSRILANCRLVEVKFLFFFLFAAVDAVGQYFEQSLSAYKNSVGLQDPAFLSVQDDFCRFLLINGQREVKHNRTELS